LAEGERIYWEIWDPENNNFFVCSENVDFRISGNSIKRQGKN